ncbi:hypothetical protein LguiA_012596 [Lonicera macranthoides]
MADCGFSLYVSTVEMGFVKKEWLTSTRNSNGRLWFFIVCLHCGVGAHFVKKGWLNMHTQFYW